MSLYIILRALFTAATITILFFMSTLYKHLKLPSLFTFYLHLIWCSILIIEKSQSEVSRAFLGQSFTYLCPFIGCLQILHLGGAFAFFSFCFGALTMETKDIKNIMLPMFSRLHCLLWKGLKVMKITVLVTWCCWRDIFDNHFLSFFSLLYCFFFRLLGKHGIHGNRCILFQCFGCLF